MIEDDVLDLAESALASLAPTWRDGFELVQPEPLTILRIALRPVRLHWIPYLGRTRSLVLVARHPADVEIDHGGDAALLHRLALAAESVTPWRVAPSVVFTGIILTPRPIDPDDEARIAAALQSVRRARAIPLGLFRINPGQESLAFSLRRGPSGLFPEPEALADACCNRLRRFVASLP
ncbi:MAG: hypothetical protein KatS3mg108_2115 [Isosphaeraceae bacterium]|jgi:hypothetical protein|nr:MAG: hypothetical protein KatS3mg108_2115 [Isosphaeraceae bacterium]